MLEHGVHRMEQLACDNNQHLLSRFALSLLAEINGAPLATKAYGIGGGEVEGMAGNARVPMRDRRGGAAWSPLSRMTG